MTTAYLITMNGNNQPDFLKKWEKYSNLDYDNSNIKLNFLLNRVKHLQKEFTKKINEFEREIKPKFKDPLFLEKLAKENLTRSEFLYMERQDMFNKLLLKYDDEIKFTNILENLSEKFVEKKIITDIKEVEYAKNIAKIMDNNNENENGNAEGKIFSFFLFFYLLIIPQAPREKEREQINLEMNIINNDKKG